MKRECDICRELFESRGRLRVCSVSCRNERMHRQNRKHYDTYRDREKARAAKYKQENPEKVRAGYRTWYQEEIVQKRHKARSRQRTLNQYRLTLDDYRTMMNAQKCWCAICGCEAWELPYELVIDHCHSSGKIRGLLCRNCNLFLGLAADDPARLDRAAAYLREHQL